ncbi:hypothetical protein [Candidatus Nanohalovita haloferacivicina]|uniref:hypothetical protein n=1 Tax=Candidatus Nanohalovita haloferacivicina TaxID=2978046 RepID=UPI00325FDABD|nr:hypothetical protein HBNXNv_0674 [Candidatus Nanohalobia archaeon BNXNv]
MALGLFSSLPQEYSTVILLVLLLAAFIAAFKLMEMVFETIMVSVLSAGTYIAFTQLVYGTMPGLNDILLFAFAGASLYVGYTVLASAYGIAETLISIPYRILKHIYSGIKKLVGAIREKSSEKKKAKKQAESDREVKEVVLDKMKGEKEEGDED